MNPVTNANEAARLPITNGPLISAQVSTYESDLAFLAVFAATLGILGYAATMLVLGRST
jgi:hypothetical protein